MQHTIDNSLVENKEAWTGMLTNILDDSMMLYSKTKEIHWTARGASFMELNDLFEGQYNKLQQAIDEIALLKKEMGIPVTNTVKKFMYQSSLQAAPDKYNDKNEMLKELLGDHETVIKVLNKNITNCEKKYNDYSLADFLRYHLQRHLSITFELRKYLMNERKLVN